MARVSREATGSTGTRSLRGGGFRPVYRGGRRSRQRGVLVIAAAADRGPAQVGIVAGRDVGNAVRRNRAKRRLREAMRRVPLRHDTAYIAVATPDIDAVGFDQLVEAVARGIADIEEVDR